MQFAAALGLFIFQLSIINNRQLNITTTNPDRLRLIHTHPARVVQLGPRNDQVLLIQMRRHAMLLLECLLVALGRGVFSVLQRGPHLSVLVGHAAVANELGGEGVLGSTA